MKIKSLNIKNFRKFDDDSISFKPGLNEIIQENEWGKTTFVDAIRYALTDDKIKTEDIKKESANNPDISLKVDVESKDVEFTVTGTDLKSKPDRKKISDFFGNDYNYLIDTLLIVKHRDIENFVFDNKYIERILKFENIAEYNKKLNTLFTRKEEITTTELKTYNTLVDKIVYLENEIKETEEKLLQSEQSRAKLEKLNKELKNLDNNLNSLKSEESVLKLFHDKAELTEQKNNLKKLEIKKSKLNTDIERGNKSLSDIAKSIETLEKNVNKTISKDIREKDKEKNNILHQSDKLKSILKSIADIEKKKSIIEKKIPSVSLKILSDDLKNWEKSNGRLDLGSKIGLRAEFTGKNSVTANNKSVTSGLDVEFDNRIKIIIGNNVKIDVWTGGKSIAKDSSVTEQMAEKYGTVEKLEKLIETYEEYNVLKDELKDLLDGKQKKDLDNELNKLDLKLKKVVEDIKNLEKSESQQKKEEAQLNSLEKKKAEIKNQLKNDKQNISEVNEKISEIESVDDDHFNEINKELGKLPHEIVEKYKEFGLTGLKTEINNTISQKDKIRDSIIQKKDEVMKIQRNISDVSFDELEQKRSILNNELLKKKSADDYIAVLHGLKAVLPLLAEKLQEQVFIEIQNKTFEYFKMITGNSFESLLIKSESKGKRNYILKNLEGLDLEGINYLSDGTKDQLFFALRFAMIKQFSGDNPKFIILDEPFAHTDKTREAQIRSILNKFVDDGWQVIMFSCK